MGSSCLLGDILVLKYKYCTDSTSKANYCDSFLNINKGQVLTLVLLYKRDYIITLTQEY